MWKRWPPVFAWPPDRAGSDSGGPLVLVRDFNRDGWVTQPRIRTPLRSSVSPRNSESQMKKLLLVAPLLFMAPLLSVAQQAEQVDLNTIHEIKEETLGRNSKVMDHVFYLTDVNGPRLQNSKGYRAAGDWAVMRLKEYGLSNVHLEKWAPFGKGWNLEHYSGHMLEPQYQPIIAMPMAWTAGTDGVVTGNPIRHEDVRGLDVTMDDSFRVCRIQRIGDLDAQIEHRLDLHRLCLYLVAEGLRIVGEFVGKELQGDVTTELEVFRLVDHAHSAAADLAEDAVVRDDLANHLAEILRLGVEQVNEGQQVGGVS